MKINWDVSHNLTLMKCIVSMLDGEEMNFTYDLDKRINEQALLKVMGNFIKDYEKLKSTYDLLEQQYKHLKEGIDNISYNLAIEDTSQTAVVQEIHRMLINLSEEKTHV
jgi:hypothetical protein